MIAAGIAPVVIDNAAAGAYSLITDNENSAYEAVKHLTKFSRNKRIGIVLGGGYSAINLNIQSQRERLSGYKRALAENSMPFDESLIWYIQNFNYQAGKDAFRFMLSSNVDAVFCAAGDYVALGFLSEARLQGVSIPGSMSIVGFDDIEIAKDLDLTTVRQPLEEMGREAFKTAVEAVTSHELRGTVKEFKNTLILRNTA
jgi:DNA-binding LacI/PurR family transcriptional regulator